MRHPSFQRGDTRCKNKTVAVDISSSEEDTIQLIVHVLLTVGPRDLESKKKKFWKSKRHSRNQKSRK